MEAREPSSCAPCASWTTSRDRNPVHQPAGRTRHELDRSPVDHGADQPSHRCVQAFQLPREQSALLLAVRTSRRGNALPCLQQAPPEKATQDHGRAHRTRAPRSLVCIRGHVDVGDWAGRVEHRPLHHTSPSGRAGLRLRLSGRRPLVAALRPQLSNFDADPDWRRDRLRDIVAAR